MGFPDSSVGKESICNAGDPSSIPELVRSPGERIGYPLQYSWVSFVAQLVKNPLAMQETWVWSPGEGKGCPLQYSGLENSMGCLVHGIAKSWTWPSEFHFCRAKVLIFDKVQFVDFFFPFMEYSFGVMSKDTSSNPRSWRFSFKTVL